MESRPLIDWADAIGELVSFVATFLAAGAVGLRYAPLRGKLDGGATPAGRLLERAAMRAAALGLIATLYQAIRIAMRLPAQAAKAHTTTMAFATGNGSMASQLVLIVLAIIGFALAWRGVKAGWPLAAIGVVFRPLRGLVFTGWNTIVNPTHALAGGLWIGTLFFLTVLVLVPLMRDAELTNDRGSLAADVVNDFSPLALASAAVLVFFGVNTAIRHLKYWSAIWTTPYGWTFVAKLVVVTVVFTLGAWNWRRGRGRMGDDAGASMMRRSASRELTVAGVVLVITAILVSLPTPRAPGDADRRPPAPESAPPGGPPPQP